MTRHGGWTASGGGLSEVRGVHVESCRKPFGNQDVEDGYRPGPAAQVQNCRRVVVEERDGDFDAHELVAAECKRAAGVVSENGNEVRVFRVEKERRAGAVQQLDLKGYS